MSVHAAGVRERDKIVAQFCATGGQSTILFGLLLAVEFAAALMPPYWEQLDLIWALASTAAVGTALAWPALLAVWAVFGPQRAALRLPLTLWLAMAVELCSMYGSSRDSGETVNAVTAGTGIGWLFAFLVLQLLLWLIRAVRGWRLKLPEYESADDNAPESSPPRAKSPRQFSLRALLGWILAAALLLVGWRWAARDVSFTAKDIAWSLNHAAAITPRIVLGGLPVVALTWIVLAEGRRLVFRTVLGLMVLAGLSAVSGYSEDVGQWLSLPPIARSPGKMLATGAGAMINGLFCLGIVCACGYRLRRDAKERGRATACNPQAPKTISNFRFALALVPLVVVAASLAWSVPQRLAQWRRAEVEFGWGNIGLEASFDEDRTATGLECRHKPPLPDEICHRIASLGDLRVLDLAGSTIDDRQLGLLAPLARLESLDLSSTAITDEGLKQLAQFPQLRHLKLENTAITDSGLAPLQVLTELESLQLSLTEVTDDGLSALARLPALKALDVRLTAVSDAGAERFLKLKNFATIEYGASHDLLSNLRPQREYVWYSSNGPGSESHHFRISNIKLKRLHARGRAIGNDMLEAVNNVSLINLVVGQKELEELDLRDSEVNDLGIYELSQFKKLKRLDLRGSRVTEDGVQQLSRALPDCEILR